MQNITNVDCVTQAYIEIENALSLVTKGIKNDVSNGHELFMPHCNSESESLDALLNSISRTRNDEKLPKSGLLCASPNTIASIEILNSARKAFKVACQQVKADDGAEKNPNRGEALAKALRAAELQSVDLRTIEAQLRILSPSLRSVSWTWQMKHPTMNQYTVAEALALAEKLSDEKAQKAARIDLNQLDANEILVVKKDLPPQLKANIQYFENDELVKKTISVSGVLVVPGKNLPLHCWRDKPDKPADRLSRPKKIENEQFVPVLQMYRYVSP